MGRVRINQVEKLYPYLSMNAKGISEDDRKIIEALRCGGREATYKYFYVLLRSVLEKIRQSLFSNTIDYEDLVGELYLFLSRSEWKVLQKYNALNNASFITWSSAVAWNYFLRHRLLLMMAIRATSSDSHIEESNRSSDSRILDSIDIRKTLDNMPNNRYADIIRMLLIEGRNASEVAEKLHTVPANIYNLKRRAIQQFIRYYGGGGKD